MNDKVLFKIFPWASKIGSKQTMELVDHLNDQGFQVELEYVEDRDNGRIPILIVWGDLDDS